MALGMCVTDKIIIASTPHENSYFNEMYLDSLDEENNWNSIRLHWDMHPYYSKGIKKNPDENSPIENISPWFTENTFRLNTDQIEQEFECVVKFKGRTIKSKTISLRLSLDLHKKIKNKLDHNESISDYIRDLIKKDIKS